MSKKGVFYVVGTPIGNLEDITYRAVKVLEATKVVICEDVRETANLLSNYFDTSSCKFYSIHDLKEEFLLTMLSGGSDVCLVSDRGTPLVSDPGNWLVRSCYENDVKVSTIPGPSALTAFLSIAGCKTRFAFYGFLPKSGVYNTLNGLKKIYDNGMALVFFESALRIKDVLRKAKEVYPDSFVCVGRELTKQHETIYRGELTDDFIENLIEKGEYTYLIQKLKSTQSLEVE